jgi:ABC-type multidrug transport system ATPase subunit
VVGYAGPELAFYDEMSVAENLRFVAETRGLRDAAGSVATALERVGLAVRAHDRADALSSGMKARLRLAFALLHRPRILLLDEPGSHMDEDGRQTLERIVKDEARHGLVVIATNEERERALAHRRIELRGSGLGPAA